MRDRTDPKEKARPDDENKSTGTPDIARNPNPRANENIQDAPSGMENTEHQTGSEITDGEDA